VRRGRVRGMVGAFRVRGGIFGGLLESTSEMGKCKEKVRLIHRNADNGGHTSIEQSARVICGDRR
jgi:hypothetical protein